MKIKKILKNFDAAYFATFDNLETDREKVIRYIANSYLQFFRPLELEEFLKEWLIHYGLYFNIISSPGTIRKDIWFFIADIMRLVDKDIIKSYPSLFEKLNELFFNEHHGFYDDIVDHYEKIGTKKLYSFSEIIEQKHYKLSSINTLKKYIEILEIEIYTERLEKPGKFITDSDLKKILSHIEK
jgi:hypothetical protein